MQNRFDSTRLLRTYLRHVWAFFAVALLAFPLQTQALTVRTKGDLRLWETVTDRSQPLNWPWADGADTAVVTFSSRLSRAVSSVTVRRTSGDRRGSCAHPVPATAEEGLVVARLVQFGDGVEIARDTAELAYVPGLVSHGEAGGVVTRPISVLSKASRSWWVVSRPRMAGFDARWWNLEGPSGYEVIWAKSTGPHRVTRVFQGHGTVDAIVLRFVLPGFFLRVF